MKKMKFLFLSLSLFFGGVRLEQTRRRLLRLEHRLPLSHPRVIRSASLLEKRLHIWQKKERLWHTLQRLL